MAEPTNLDEAAQALAAANSDDQASQADPQANQPDPSPPVADPDPVAEPAQFTDVNLDDLPDEAKSLVEKRLADMQGDYTRKTQELAEQRQEAEQAIQFIQNLQSDPDFALQIRDEISTALEQAGHTPAQARAEADRQVGGLQNEVVDDEDVDPLQAKVSELEAWKTEQEERQLILEEENKLDRMDARIRQENPNFVEDDMEDIYALAYATGGNLLEAADYFKKMNSRIVEGYVNKKDGVRATEPGATGGAQTPPEPFHDVLDPRLFQAAKRRLIEAGEDV